MLKKTIASHTLCAFNSSSDALPALTSTGNTSFFQRKSFYRHFKNMSGLCLAALIVCGCTVYDVSRYDAPTVEVPDNYLTEREGVVVPQKWWEEFKQPQLNILTELALVQNLDIKQAWSRLAQARANVCIVASDLYHKIDLTGSIEYKGEVKRDDNNKTQNSSGITYLLSPSLSYEVDLWKRIDSKVKAAQFGECTSVEELEATALVLTGSVVDLWLTIQEQKELLKLIHHQIEVSQTLLELVELRFSIGKSSALAVYQQRLQFEETRASLIPVEAQLRTSNHQLHVLLGEPPEDFPNIDSNIFSVTLPPFPDLGTPAQLLERRPDLRSAQYKLAAADYEVAAAVADCFPRLTLPMTAEFKTKDCINFFKEQVYKMTARLVEPLIDGGRRRCEVERRKAIVKERLDAFGQRFLNALREVEDAIVNEKAQEALIEQLRLEVDIARLNLEEAHQRYATGLNDYLTVIAAIQSLQRLERRMIVEHRKLLVNRSKLYRALGVPCLVGCSDSATCGGEAFIYEEEGE